MASRFAIIFGAIAVIGQDNTSSAEFDCRLLETQEAALDGGMSLVKSFVESNPDNFSFDQE